MTLSQKKIQKILDLYRLGFPINTIATIMKIDRKTVRKYLEQNGLLAYSYPCNQQYGPPPLYHPYTDFTCALHGYLLGSENLPSSIPLSEE